MDMLAQMEAQIPKDGVRTRFAPSPTGYMHVGNLRTALYTWLIARSMGGTFILRIEDTDQERYVEGATDVVYKTLAECGLAHDEGPDVGGPVGPYVQSQRRDTYLPCAKLLVENGAAYYCFCEKAESEEDSGAFDREADPCRDLGPDDVQRRLDAGQPWVIRQKIPLEGSTTFHDVIFGDITVPNADLDDQVLIKRDGMPTYNFANVVDDHLMGITHVVRGTEYLSSTPKYNLLYNAFGWEIPAYIHCSPVMKDAQHKLSKRSGDASYQDLVARGYLTEAILNYVALLGWSPGGEREKYSLTELVEAFQIEHLSHSPAVFDTAKLTWLNGEYIRALTPERFIALAEPWLKTAITNPDIDLRAVATLVQSRCEILSDLPDRVAFLQALPSYDPELYRHKKMKTNPENSLASLKAAMPVLESLSDWSNAGVYDALRELAKTMDVKNGVVLWPVRVAVSGLPSTPGGASELCALLGREESLRRIQIGIDLLSAD